MKQAKKIYIVGAGSFALLTYRLLGDFKLDVVGFIDEQYSGSIDLKPVITASLLANTPCLNNANFFIAVSNAEHQLEAISRLESCGVENSQILNLRESTALIFLRSLYGMDAKIRHRLLKQPVGSIGDIEVDMLGTLQSRLPSFKKQRKKISLNFYAGGGGGGGGFRQHLQSIAQKMMQDYSVVSFSDEKDEGCDKSINLVLQSHESSMQNKWSDLAIAAHFIPCSHPDITKVTFMHVIYDYCLFGDVLYRAISQPKKHYIFASSKPAFDGIKELLLGGNYNNDVILIPGGYPRLDDNRLKHQSNCLPVDTIIYAPTASIAMPPKTELTYSIYQAREILACLDQCFPGYRIVFRPHPKDLSRVRAGAIGATADALNQAVDYCQNSRCELDEKKNQYMDNYSRAAVMISDTSSTAFTYALTTKRPVLFFAPGNEVLIRELGSFHYIRDREYFGGCVSTVESMKLKLNDMLERPDKYTEKNQEHAKKILFNDGVSEKYFMEILPYILNDAEHPDFWYLQRHKQPENKA